MKKEATKEASRKAIWCGNCDGLGQYPYNAAHGKANGDVLAWRVCEVCKGSGRTERGNARK